MTEEKTCLNCRYDWCREDDVPCVNCKNTALPHSEEYNYRTFLWQPIVKETNNVNHPSHYNQGGIECIDAMVSAFGKEAVGNFCICNAFKYVWRAKQKNGVEDLDKAIWYLNKVKELTANEAV